jgi:hypothetical protein
MVLITKADISFKDEEARKKGILTGSANFMYAARPKLRKDGLSKLLVDTTKVALKQAEERIFEELEANR